jgi:lipopolysaccharide assembly protein A
VSQVIVFLALAFSIVIAIFAVQNTTPVAVQFLGFRADAVAVSVLVLISAALGAAAMLLLGIAREVSLRWRHRAVAQQLKAAQARIAELQAAQGTVALPTVSSAGSLSEKTVMGPPEPAATSPTTGDGQPDAKR